MEFDGVTGGGPQRSGISDVLRGRGGNACLVVQAIRSERGHQCRNLVKQEAELGAVHAAV
ncbi:MAG: hypothetical protein EOP21_01855 [Hyphomicrobiales bacterium]|nr:MAG: hypothetical protein EOP21_01855 [Hyphomicrobiales bacterium]